MKKLHLESLEERTLLAVTAGIETAVAAAPNVTTASLVVTTLSDVVDDADGLVSLREAISNAEEGDTVTFDASLAGGTISLGSTLSISKGIAVDASETGITVSGNNSFTIFNITGGTEDAPAQLIGLTITGGYASARGGGVYINAAVVSMTDCTLTANSAAKDGGAVHLNYNSALSMTGCTITGNSAHSGGGVSAYSAATLTDCVITNNTVQWYGGGLESSIKGGFTLIQTQVTDNTSGCYGGAIYSYGPLTAYNCTVAGNTATKDGGGIYARGTTNLYNSIVAGNLSETTINTDYYRLVGGSHSVYNVAYGYANGGQAYWNNEVDCVIVEDASALFADMAGGDYTLAAGSVAIDAGNNDYVATDADLAGEERIVNNIVDLGVYEYQGGADTEQLAAPAILTGTGGYYVSYGGNRHQIVWEAVDNAASYRLAYSADGGDSWTTLETEETSAIVTGLTMGAKMTYRVSALGSGAYTDSEWSDSAAFNVCPMDIDGDGDIGPADFALMRSAWLAEEGDADYLACCDIDGDGEIGLTDRIWLSKNWLEEADSDDLVFPAVNAVDAAFASTDLGIELRVW